MRVQFSQRALKDLDEAFRYLDSQNPQGARNVLSAIHAAIRTVAERPFASEGTDNPQVRVKLVLRYRYKIFYRVGADTVEILHVRHTARRPWRG